MFRKSIGKFVFQLVSILTLLVLSASPAPQDGGGINGDALQPGDFVTQGDPTGNGDCEFDEFTITTSGRLDDSTNWLSISANEECQFIVDAKWAGELEDGPPAIIDPLLDLLQYETSEVEGTESNESFEEHASLAAVTCKNSHQYVFMYGFGGTLDKLTKKWGTLHFCYTGSSATISTHSSTCSGSNLGLGWQWVVVQCTSFGVSPGPASSVQRSGRGNYKCTPAANAPCNLSSPDGYNHQLTETITGTGSGTSSCTYGFSGQIVSGVGRTIIQGCN